MGSLKNIFIVVLVLGLFVVGFNYFISGVTTYYSVAPDEDYQDFYNVAESQANSTQKTANSMKTALESFSTANTPVESLASGILLTTETIKFIVFYPLQAFSSLLSLMSAAAKALNIPATLLGFIVAIVIIYIIYLIIRALRGTEI